MKCRNCGHEEVGMYKEIKQLFSEMGISKDDVKKELSTTIESLVKSSISVKIDDIIARTVKSQIEGMFSSYNSDSKKMITKIIQDAVAELVAGQLDITISLK